MKLRPSNLGLVAVLAVTGFAPDAQAALLGVSNGAYSDVTLGNSVLVYDSNYNNTNTGRLVVVSVSSQLKTPTGQTMTAQTYAGAGDTQPYEEMLTINVNNQTGAFISGSVSINRGNSTTAPGLVWNGTVTNFGFGDTGRAFDATWQVSGDQYYNLPGATFGNYTTNALAGTRGGIILAISGTTGLGGPMTGATGWFNKDWLVGTTAGASNTNLNTYAASLGLSIDASATRLTSSSVTADVFVPLPAPLLLLGSSLLAAGAALRRRSAAATAPGAALA